MPATSSNRGFTVPTNLGDVGVWGTELNTTITSLDTLLGGVLTLQSSAASTVTLTSSQALFGKISVAGTFTSSFTLNFLSSNFALGEYTVQNQSTASGFNVVCFGSGGTTAAIFPGTERAVYSDGANVIFSDQPTLFASVEFIMDGVGSVPSSGVKGFALMPFTMQVTQWTILTDTSSATATLDILKSSYSGFPGSLASVTGTSQPVVSTAAKAQSTGLAGWTTTWNNGDCLEFTLTAPSNFTKLTLAVTGLRQLSS